MKKDRCVNAKYSAGETLLIAACKKGNFDIVKLLLENKADINIKDDRDNTAIHYAAQLEDKSILKLLIESKENFYNN